MSFVQGTAWAQTTDTTTYRLTGTRIAFGQDVRVERDEEVSDAAIVIGGSLTIDGRVRDGVVVVGGDLHLSATADVRGEIVIVGGQLTRDAGARQVGQRQLHLVWRVVAAQASGGSPSIRFGEVGRWLSLAGTIARVSVLGGPDGGDADRGARAGGARRPRRARRAAARVARSASPRKCSSFRS